MNELGNVSLDDYLRIRQEVTTYLDEQEFKKLPTTFDKLDSKHKEVVSNYADLVYQNAKLIEPEISKDLSTLLEDGNAKFTSFEHRLKTVDSIRRKIIADSSDYKGSYYRAMDNICDSVRYTFIIEDEMYVSQIEKYLRELEDMGYEVIEFANYWGTKFYQGINTKIVSKNGKDIFELQFHTPMGYYVKETCTRDLYQVVRDPNAPEDLIKDANRLRRLFQGSVKIPEGVIVNSEKYQYSSSSKRR